MTPDLAYQIVHDLKRQLPQLEKQAAPVRDASVSAFHH
jgi:hypothetical protein